jgi:hypothetical protein
MRIIRNRVLLAVSVWQRFLGIKTRPHARVLLDPNGRIEFFSTTASVENMRQLVSRSGMVETPPLQAKRGAW